MRASQLALVIQQDSRRDISAALILIGEALPVLKTSDGCGIRDASDMRKAMEELAEALNPPILRVPFEPSAARPSAGERARAEDTAARSAEKLG